MFSRLRCRRTRRRTLATVLPRPAMKSRRRIRDLSDRGRQLSGSDGTPFDAAGVRHFPRMR